jgi:serine/threonine protein kinase
MPERYEFVRKVAQGGFGRVYVARDTRLGREVAIKRLLSREESASFEQAQATFEREATTLAAMQHPNIVQIFDFDSDEEGTYVVMEMLDGETLKDRLNRGPLTWDTFVSVTRQALDAINAAHLKGILHRDLKPENLFLHKTGTGMKVLKILDFGLAKLSSAPSRQTMDQAGNVFGSIYYMAPEQFMREPLDGRTDLYALGCVFYQALTSRFPFYGENMQSTMEAHMSHDVKHIRDRRPDVEAPVADWLMRLISFRPEDRPADAISALRGFEAALEGKTLQPPPKAAGPVPPLTARPDRRQAEPPRTPAGPATSRFLSSATPLSSTPPTAHPSHPAQPSNPPTSRPTGPSPPSSTVTGKSPMRAISALEASRAEARAKLEASKRRKRLAIMLGAPIVGAVVLYVALTRPWEKFSLVPGPDPVAKTKKSKNPKSKTPPPKTPTAAVLPDAAPLVLPMEDALAWRFRAGADLRYRGADGKSSKALRDQKVDLWRNLAATAAMTALRPIETDPVHAPTACAGDIRGPETNHAYVDFSTESGMSTSLKGPDALKAPGNATSQPKGVTLAIVFRAYTNSKENSMRPLVLFSTANPNQNFSLHFSHRVGQYWAVAERDGQVAQSLATPEEFARRKSGASGHWVVAMATWDAQEGTVTIRVRSPDGKIANGNPAKIPPGMSPLDKLNLGYVSVPKGSKLDPKERFDGDITEVSIYRQALDPATQDRVINALWERYFLKR